MVDQYGRVYVADGGNDRVVRWSRDGKEGIVIVGGNREGKQSNQLDCSLGLTFDRQENLYVVDHYNHRLRKFLIDWKRSVV